MILTVCRALPALALAALIASPRAWAAEPVRPALPPPPPTVALAASVPTSRPAHGTLDLRQALDRAARQSPLIDAAKAGTEAFEARLDQAKSNQYPLVTLQSLITPMPAKTGGRTSGHTDYGRWGVFVYTEVSGAMPLYGFSKLQHLKAAARLGVSVGKATEDVARAEVRFRVLKGWYGLALAREMQAILGQGRDYFDRAKRHVAEQKAADDASFDPIDEMKIRVYEAQLKSRELEASRLGTLALGNLRWALGEDPQDGPDVATRPPEFVTPLKEVTLDEAIDTAVNGRPELVALRRGLAAGSADARARYWAMYPDLVLTGKFNYAYSNVADHGSSPFAGNPFNGWNASGGLAVRWDLDLGRKLGEWHEAVAARHRQDAALDEAERGVRLDVETLYRQMVDAKALVHTQQDALKSAVFWVESKLDLLESNQGSLRDVLDGLFQFLQARLVAEMAVYDYDVAVAALERTSGLALVPVASAAGDR